MYNILLVGVLVVLGWGAFAFGAVYPWAFTPLAVAAAMIGLVALVLTRTDGRPRLAGMTVALAAIGAGVIVQLVPLPPSVLARVSPGSVEFLRQYNLAYIAAATPDPQSAAPAAGPPSHAISIAPSHTAVGLALFGALAVFMLGCARLLSRTGARPLALGLLWMGVALALVGVLFDLVQRGQDTGSLAYGFWKPEQGGSPFGPFINRNHFAGWILMVLPLALALFVDVAQRAFAAADDGRRDIMGVVNTPLGGRVIMMGLGCVLMGAAATLTRSRSGVAGLLTGGLVLFWTLLRRLPSKAGRLAVVAGFVAVVGLSILGVGLDTAVGRFVRVSNVPGAQSTLTSAGGRIGAWRDALGMARRSPATGLGLNTFGTGMIVFQTGPHILHFNEAHNDYLQLVAEGGLLLCVPIIAAVWIFSVQVRRRFREAPKIGTSYWLRIGAVAGLLSIAVQSVFEFSLQMPGNAALCAALAGLALHQSPRLHGHGSAQPDPADVLHRPRARGHRN